MHAIEEETTPVRADGTMLSHANPVIQFPRDCVRDLAFKFSKSLSEAENPGGAPPSPPKDFASLNLWLQQRNQMCNSFLDSVTQGKYASIGLVDVAVHDPKQ